MQPHLDPVASLRLRALLPRPGPCDLTAEQLSFKLQPATPLERAERELAKVAHERAELASTLLQVGSSPDEGQVVQRRGLAECKLTTLQGFVRSGGQMSFPLPSLVELAQLLSSLAQSSHDQLAGLEEVQTILVQVRARRSWMQARCLRVLQAAVRPC
jgi:hypothetical protein